VVADTEHWFFWLEHPLVAVHGRGRIIDLSRAAARELDMISAPVRQWSALGGSSRDFV
jgi:hypothetical protein